MGLFSKTGWKEWARQWGLTYHAPRFMSTTREWMAGSYRGYLVKVGWMGERHAEFFALIRFPKVPEGAIIRERLLQDPGLAELPGWTKLKPADGSKSPRLLAIPNGGAVSLMRSKVVGAAPLLVDDSSLVWTRPCPWRRPSTEQLQGWVEKLIVALAQVTRGFEGRCEQCGSELRGRYVMVNGAPVHLCQACQQDLIQKGRTADAQYAQTPAHHALGTLYGLAAAAVGGGLWAAISTFTERMFALVAIGIAFFVGFAYRYGAKKMDLAGQAIGVVLTLAGVVFGDVLYYAALVMQKQPEVGFRLDAGWTVFAKLLRQAPADIGFSLFCGLIGSLYVVGLLAKPKFVPKIESAEDRKAA